MTHHLFSAALLAAAVIFEIGGFAGATAMLGAGVVCELWFWSRVVRDRPNRSSPP